MITYFKDLQQGSDEWLAARCGLLTASEMKKIITPTLKVAANDKERAHLYELVAQRITQYTEPSYLNDNMLRGITDEVEAVIIYQEKIAPVTSMGFITNDRFGFLIGYSPDGLIGDDGLIEVKSKKQSLQVEVIVNGEVPIEHVIQIQTGLMVSERQWCEFISYNGGMPLVIYKVYPDLAIQTAILAAASVFEEKAAAMIERYKEVTKGMIMTERKIIEEMVI